MTRKEKYRTDEAYRKKVNAANRARYHRSIKDPLYAKLCATRARINNARVSIEHHQKRLDFFFKRIENDQKLIRKLIERRKELLTTVQ